MKVRATVAAHGGALRVERTGPDSAVVSLSGPWLSVNGLPDPAVTLRELQADAAVHHLAFDARRVTGWDSGLLTFVLQLLRETRPRGIAVDRTGLPEGARRLAVLRFDGSPGREVTLDTRWRLVGKNAKDLVFRRSTITERVTGSGVPALVAVMNRAISTLSQEIAVEIQTRSADRLVGG